MEAAAVRLYFLLEHNYSLVTCILLGYDANSCTRNKFQQRQYCARVMHFSAFHYYCFWSFFCCFWLEVHNNYGGAESYNIIGCTTMCMLLVGVACM